MVDELVPVRGQRKRLADAEHEIWRLRAALRGVKYKVEIGSYETALAIIDRALHKSVRAYPHPIEDEKEDPTEVKR